MSRRYTFRRVQNMRLPSLGLPVNAPRFVDESEKLSTKLNGRVAVVYNSRFHAGVIQRACKMRDTEPPSCGNGYSLPL